MACSLLLHAGPAEFRTGWFVESVVSATLIVLVVRSRGRAVASLPSTGLLVATVAVALGTLVLPLTPLAGPMGFTPLPAVFLPALGAIVGAYLASAEGLKRAFYRRIAY